MNTFAESHKDFVLKLKLIGEGDEVSQIRRVRLPRIIKDNIICYEELVGLAIAFVIPQYPSNASDFHVNLTYHDVDNDTVVIGSSDELLDAINQFSEQNVLRIIAEVKRVVKTGTSPPFPSPSPVGQPSRASFAAVVCDSDVQTGSGASTRSAPVIQSVVESVVNVILNAAVAMSSRGDQHQAENIVFYSPDGIPAPAPAESTREEYILETPADAVDVEARTMEEIPVQNLVPPDLAPAVQTDVPPYAAATEDDGEKKPSASDKRPFIHGRHTCDSCLTTPIVGKRYHAINLSDYDLCEKCYGNYKGGEITFEAVELDRDRHLQVRWNRRRDSMNNCKGQVGGLARRLGAAVGHHTRWGPGSGPSDGHSCGPPRPQLSTVPLPPPPGPPLPWYSLETPSTSKMVEGDLDEALRLAIQMSLQEAEENKLPPASSAPPAIADDASYSESMHIFFKASAGKAVAQQVGPSDAVSDLKVKACVKASKNDAEATAASSTVGENLMAVSPPMLKGGIAESVLGEIVMDEDKLEGRAMVPKTPAPADKEVMSVMAYEANADAFVAPDGLVVHMPSGTSVVSIINSKQSHGSPFETKENGSSREASFSSEAAGNGDVADLLGSTLDKCAEAIDAMVTELSREYGDNHSANSSFVGLQNAGDKVDDSDNGFDVAGRQTILESVDSSGGQYNEVHSELVKCEEDWHVVNDEQESGGDEELARAAQLIGSALFNSDIRSSQGQMSALSGSADVVSFTSSVPTFIPLFNSNIVAAQRERWAIQLSQLHAMGFHDDACCVEILERLMAASIGCGNSDEVSVSQVVNELLKL